MIRACLAFEIVADGSIPEDGMRLVLEQAAREAKLAREVSLTEVADLNILRQAQKELGLGR